MCVTVYVCVELCYVCWLFTCFRLQYFARGVQVYIKQLRVALQGKTGDALKTEDVRHNVMHHPYHVPILKKKT